MDRGQAGRAAWSWVFTAALFVGAFCGLRFLEGTPRGWLIGQGERAQVAAKNATTRVWFGASQGAAETRLRAGLLPLHAGCASDGSCVFGTYRAQRLVERLGIEREGELLRLVLELEMPEPEGPEDGPASSEVAPENPGSLRVLGVRLVDAQGEERAVSLHTLVDAETARDPLLHLFLQRPDELSLEEGKPWMLWGSLQSEDTLRLELDVEGRAEALLIELQSEEASVHGLPRWFGRTAQEVAFAGEDPRDAEIARLKRELEVEKEKRFEREMTWFEFNRTLASMRWNTPAFPQDAKYAPLASPSEAALPKEEEPEPDPELLRQKERARTIGIALNALMRIEGLRGLDLLEPGLLHGEFIGPVVFRTLDVRGRLTGSLSAKRLRLEASRAARTLTIVLEEGTETIAGETAAFSSGVRRIVLPHVDPEDWLEQMPELFVDRASELGEDDGRWHLPSLRLELNRLLALDAASGFFRVRAIGGCWGDSLVGLHLEEFDGSGRVLRRFFADRARIQVGEGSVVLELFDGAIVRGGEKALFREGVHRIYLLRTPQEEWRRAKIPRAGSAASESSGEGSTGNASKG